MSVSRFSSFAIAVTLSAILSIARSANCEEIHETLFRKGQGKLKARKFEDAVQDFRSSYFNKQMSGPLLKLGWCFEQLGKLASASSNYELAARLAEDEHKIKKDRQKYIDNAMVGIERLKSKVSSFLITGLNLTPGLVVKIGEETIEIGASGQLDLPRDAGTYKVTATAPGYEDWSKTLTLDADGLHLEVSIPALAKLPAASQQPAQLLPEGKPAVARTDTPLPKQRVRNTPNRTEHTVSDGSQPSRTLAYVLGGAGTVVLGTGAAFGWLASSTYKQANSSCPTHSDCSEAALHERADAERWANFANLGVGVGLVGLAVGTLLWVTRSPSPQKRPDSADTTITFLGSQNAIGVVVGSRLQ